MIAYFKLFWFYKNKTFLLKIAAVYICFFFLLHLEVTKVKKCKSYTLRLFKLFFPEKVFNPLNPWLCSVLTPPYLFGFPIHCMRTRTCPIKLTLILLTSDMMFVSYGGTTITGKSMMSACSNLTELCVWEEGLQCFPPYGLIASIKLKGLRIHWHHSLASL